MVQFRVTGTSCWEGPKTDSSSKHQQKLGGQCARMRLQCHGNLLDAKCNKWMVFSSTKNLDGARWKKTDGIQHKNLYHVVSLPQNYMNQKEIQSRFLDARKKTQPQWEGDRFQKFERKICFFENVPTGWANKSSNGGSVMVYHGGIRKKTISLKKKQKWLNPRNLAWI